MKRLFLAAAALGTFVFLFTVVNQKKQDDHPVLPGSKVEKSASSTQRGPSHSVSSSSIGTSEDNSDQQNQVQVENHNPVLTPAALAEKIISFQQGRKESPGAQHEALNTLRQMAQEGSQPAVQELIHLANTIDDDKILHPILQSLGQLDDKDARGALLDVLWRKLESPTETTRIASYLRPDSSGYLPQETVLTLADMLTTESLPEASYQTILAVIKNRGGPYGREAVTGIVLSPSLPAH